MMGSDDDPIVAALIELAAPQPADVCLDYGAGVGRATFALAPHVDRVEAVDDRDEVLVEAERLGREIGAGSVSYRRVDLNVLPYDEPRFDLILSVMILHRRLEPVASLKEMRRVLRPRGRIIALDVVVDETTDRYLNELARLREPEHWRHYRIEEYGQMVEEAELTEIERRVVRQSVDLDAWAEEGLAPAGDLDLISARLRGYPVPAQLALDAAYADGRASFSYDVLAVRLEA